MTDIYFAVARRSLLATSKALALIMLSASISLACAVRQSGVPTTPVAVAAVPVVEFAFVEQAPASANGPLVYEHEGALYRVDELRRFRFATASRGQDAFGSPAVSLILDPRDALEFERWTEENIGRLLAVRIDGRVVTIATVQDALTGSILVAPREHWSETQAEELAARIHAAGTAAQRSESTARASSVPFQLAAPYQPEPNSVVAITLERTRCYGYCPEYTLLIGGDGAVWYHGEKSVDVIGERTSRIDPQTVRELLARFCAVDFLSLADRYAFGGVDDPSTILTLSVNGRTKRVVHVGAATRGHDENPERIAHEALYALEKAIALATGSQRWVKR